MSSPYTSEPHIVSSPNEYPLSQPPADGVSSLTFSPQPGSKDLLVSSWDGTLRLYDSGSSASLNVCKLSIPHGAPVLAAAFVDAAHSASGGLDASLKLYDFSAQRGSIPDSTPLLGLMGRAWMCRAGAWEP